jgi:hypothetical protein
VDNDASIFVKSLCTVKLAKGSWAIRNVFAPIKRSKLKIMVFFIFLFFLNEHIFHIVIALADLYVPFKINKKRIMIHKINFMDFNFSSTE